MQQIVVPCDFSQTAVHAFRFAVDIAVQMHAHIHVLHVVELPVLVDGLVPVVNFDAQFLRELKEKAESNFHRLLEKYNPEGVSVQLCVEEGPVVATIRRYTLEHRVDMIIMGSHGVSGFREFLIGSNASKMVRKSSVPVLIVKDYVKKRIANIVFPVGLIDEEDQDDVVTRVRSLQKMFNAHLHIVWINTPLRFSPDSETYRRLKDFSEKFELENYSVGVFNHFNEEKGIIDFADQVNGDLIAMGTHARQGFSYLINGSVAADIVNHGKIPVWTCSLNMPGDKFDKSGDRN